MTLPILTAEEQRVLGCLLEKEVTVPNTLKRARLSIEIMGQKLAES